MGSDLFHEKDKRGFDRRQLYYYLKVTHDPTGGLAGYLGDISTEGLMLFTKNQIELDTVQHFRINLNDGFGLDEDLLFEARSVWTEKDANPDYHIIGFKFIDLDQAGIDIVKYLMKKYGFEE